MRIISHRGNLLGANSNVENKIQSINIAIQEGFDVEIDVWLIDKTFYLGHDSPDTEIKYDFLLNNLDKLWIHCKNVQSIVELKQSKLNYFWHENDTLTITSLGHLWVYPGKQPIQNSVAVLPEIHNDPIEHCFGICTDYPIKYRDLLK